MIRPMVTSKNTLKNTLNNTLRGHRINAGLSQQELAQRAGISRQAYAALESGKAAPSTAVGLRLARGLNTSFETLFSLADQPPEPLQADLVAPEGSAGGPQDPAIRSQGSQAVKLMPVGGRLLARPLAFSMGARFRLVEADGLIVPGSQSTQQGPAQEGPARVEVRPFDAGELRMPCLSLLGCDPAMALLETSLRQKGVRLVWQEESSYQALAALSRGEAHVAGCHLLDHATGRYNVSWAKRLLPFPYTLVTFAAWQQGMIVALGNPKGISGPEHLARPDMNLVNRPPGSGSRDLLDRLLASRGIPSDQVMGYQRELPGHLQVAAAVASGMADVGIGVEAAAFALGLDFIPLEEERYDLAIPNHFLNEPGVQALLDLLRLPGLSRRLESLTGYDVSEMGSPVSLN